MIVMATLLEAAAEYGKRQRDDYRSGGRLVTIEDAFMAGAKWALAESVKIAEQERDKAPNNPSDPSRTEHLSEAARDIAAPGQ